MTPFRLLMITPRIGLVSFYLMLILSSVMRAADTLDYSDITPSLKIINTGRIFYVHGSLPKLDVVQGDYAALVYVSGGKAFVVNGSLDAVEHVVREQGVDLGGMGRSSQGEQFVSSLVQLYTGLSRRIVNRSYYLRHADAAPMDAQALAALSEICKDPVLIVETNSWEATAYVIQVGVSRPRVEKMVFSGSASPFSIDRLSTERLALLEGIEFSQPEPR